MAESQERFSIRLTKSRLDKGLLAIPKKHAHLFPTTKDEINVLFDDEETIETKSYVPDDKSVKERRIFGLGRWFARHKMKPFDRLTITVVDKRNSVYRLALDRYVRAKAEKAARDALLSASNDEVAQKSLQLLGRITKRKSKQAAKDVLVDIARKTSYSSRPRGKSSPAEQHRTVSPPIRTLLGALHQGKCQICSFTFEKKSGDPYFEVHHLDPEIGDHPANLLVLCANCHAQFEHAEVGGFERSCGWLVAVRINGKRLTVRQPLQTEPLAHIDSLLRILFITFQMGLGHFAVWKL